MNITPEWKTRGTQFESAENAAWEGRVDQKVAIQAALELQSGRRGRIDILIHEDDGSYSIIEAKATNWDAMAEHRIRPNILRHARQVMRYVYPFWERGVDVCPGLIYPRPPLSVDRRNQVEDTLAEKSIQVVWFSEREKS